MKTVNTKESMDSRSSTIMVYVIAVLYVVFGIAFLLLPQLEAEQFCYLISGGLILIGILRIGEYFIRECYKNVNQYGFSIGVFAIILGVCIIIQIQQFAEIFQLCLGIGVLLTAIIKVQNAMDMRAMGNQRFAVFLGLAIILVICAVVILVNPFSEEELRNNFTYVILIIDGIMSIISTTYLIITAKRLRKAINSENTEQMNATAEAVYVEPELSDKGQDSMQHEE